MKFSVAFVLPRDFRLRNEMDSVKDPPMRTFLILGIVYVGKVSNRQV